MGCEIDMTGTNRGRGLQQMVAISNTSNTAQLGTDGDVQFGFILTARDPVNDDVALWVMFCLKAAQAAQTSLPSRSASQLVGAMREMENNIHVHSERAHDGVVGFRATTRGTLWESPGVVTGDSPEGL